MLQIKMRALGDPGQVLALIAAPGRSTGRSAAPVFACCRMSTIRPSSWSRSNTRRDAALELNRHKVASDPMVRTFLQGWRAILAGSADMDVYEDVTG